MKQQQKQEFTQIDVFRLWKEAELSLGYRVSVRSIISETGVYHEDIKKMFAGQLVDGKKVASVVKALYEISGMLMPERVEIQTVKKETVTWLENDGTN